MAETGAFFSLHERVTNMMVSFLDYVLRHYTSLVPGKDAEIMVATQELYQSVPRFTTLVVDTPTFTNSNLYEPNLPGEQKYTSGLHTFLVSGSFTVHVVCKNEVEAQRIASLIYVVTLAKEFLFSRYGFSELKPQAIGSTILLNPEESEDVWFDVPLSFSFTANITVDIERIERDLKEVKVNVKAPAQYLSIRVQKGTT